MSYRFTNTIDDSKPYYRVEVTGDEGLLIFTRHWPRGSFLFIQVGSDKYEETKDRNGNSWLDIKTNTYKVTLMDPDKDAKLKEGIVLKDDAKVTNLSVDDAKVTNLSVEDADITEIKPTPRRGRPNNSKE